MNGRVVDKYNIDKGLRALSDWLADKGYEELGSNDYNYYQESIQAARDYLLED